MCDSLCQFLILINVVEVFEIDLSTIYIYFSLKLNYKQTLNKRRCN